MKTLLITLALILPLTAQSQQLLTIEKAVETALERNHTLMSAQYDLSASKWGQWNAVTNYLPKARLTSTATQIDNETLLRANAAVDFIKLGAGAIPGIPPGALDNIKPFAYKNSYATDFTVVQPVFNGGLEVVGIWAANAQKDRSEYTFEDTEQDVVARVKVAYLNILKTQELVALSSESVDRTRRYLETTRRRAELGSRTQTDVLRWEVQLSADEANLITAKNYLELAKLQMNDLLGIDINTQFEFEKIVRADSSTAAVTTVSRLVAAGIDTTRVTPDLLATHPSMLMLDATLNLASTGISKAWTNFLPQVNLVYKYGWEQNGSLALDGIRPWALTLSFQYPIFSSFGDFTSLEKSYAEYHRTEEQVESYKTGITMMATNAQLNVAAALKKIETTHKGYQQAIDVLNSVTRRYDSGGASNLDLIDAQTAYTSAKTGYISAVYDYYISEIQFARAIGAITK